jgi:hypothetical protein
MVSCIALILKGSYSTEYGTVYLRQEHDTGRDLEIFAQLQVHG